jgi:Holliday junction resolvase RusA-like endonuclease
MKKSIKITTKRPKGKKNNNILARGKNGKPIFRTNPRAKKDEADIAALLIEEAKKAGWEIPISSYVELDVEYDGLIDEVTIEVTILKDEPPKTRWGGRYDIQNIIDTVADALEVRKSHDGIICNDNRICRVAAVREPLIKKINKNEKS